MRNHWFWIAFGGAAITTIAACWAAWIFMIQPMDAAVKTANALAEIFGAEFEITPRISANAGVLFSQSSRVENLTTARRTLVVEQTSDTSLPDGSHPRYRAEFVSEAGIAGRDMIDINIRRGGREADITLPKAKILVLEPAAPPNVEAPGPAWEELPERMRERAIRQLRLAARRQLLDEKFPAVAERELRSRLAELAAGAGCAAFFKTRGEDGAN